MKSIIKITFLSIIYWLLLQTQLFAQSIVGLWNNEEKSAIIEIYIGSDHKYYGKIKSLKDPTINNKPKTDQNNPIKSERSNPLVGLIILKSFVKTGSNKFDNGTIYDPKNGKTYDCIMILKGNQLEVRGFVGLSTFGRTTVWTRAN